MNKGEMIGFPLARVWLTDICITGNLQPPRALDDRKYRTMPSVFCIQNTRASGERMGEIERETE